MATNVLELQKEYESLIPSMEIEEVPSSFCENVQKETSRSVEYELGKNLYITDKLDDESIARVFMKKLSESLQIKEYISKEERDRIVQAFREHPEIIKEDVYPNPPIYSIGSHLYSARPGCVEEDYFGNMAKENKVLGEILQGRDYLAEVISKVASTMGLEFEYFNDGKGNSLNYGALRMWGWGGVEEHNGDQFVAMPHEDLIDIANRFPELEVSKPDNVYAAILCLKTGANPSKTVVWDKIPTKEDDLDPDKKKEYWFTYDMIEGVDSYAMQLHAGDFGIFPAHKIHAVIGGDERCTLGCFFHIHDGKVIMRT
jgi:hypothetical protein